jgi:hypothetical protein
MPRLTGTAILAITVVVVICFVLALFSAGIIQPFFGSSPTTQSVAAVNQEASAISANLLFFDYQQYPTVAAVNYTQQWVYIIGNVTSVENQGGHYQSCVDPGEPYLYGCSYAQQMSGWIVWTWAGPSQSSHVPLDVDFTAECLVLGMSAGNLQLDSCSIA